MLCATLCRHVDCPSSFSLELCLQLCIHKLPKLTTLCFLAVRVLNFGVEHVCFVGTLAFASFGLHVIKTSWSAFGCCRSCGEPPPVPTWSSPKPCCPVSPGPQETARTTRLVFTSSIPRGDCPRSAVYRLHSSTSRSARPDARHHSSRTYATRLGHRSQVFQLVGQIASNHTRCTVDRIIRAKT